MIPARISIATLGVKNMGAMRAFYDGLGWRAITHMDGFSMYDTGGAVLCLFGHDELAHDARVPTDAGQGFRAVALALNVEGRDDVDRAIDDVRAAGGRITKEPEDAFWGGRSAYFADPEGHLWEIAWNPMGSLDARGAFVARGSTLG